MVPIVVLGQEKTFKKLVDSLSDYFSVSFVCENEVKYIEGAEILFIHIQSAKTINLEKGIVVISDCFEKVVLDCPIAVADSAFFGALDADSTVKQFITCGMNNRDTINFSSIEDGEVWVSVMREIEDIFQNKIEPFEVCVCSKASIAEYPPFCLLCIVSLMILLGKSAGELKLVLK